MSAVDLSVPLSRLAESGNCLPAPETGKWTLLPVTHRSSPRSGVECSGWGDSAENGFILALHSDNAESYVRFTTTVNGVKGGQYYQFSVWQKTQGIDFEVVRVPLVLSWFSGCNGQGVLQRDYVGEAGVSTILSEGWSYRCRTLQAPVEAQSVRVELGLRWAEGGSACWAAPSMVEVAPPSARKARIVTTRIQPSGNTSVEANTRQMAEMFDLVSKERPDLVLFSENLVDYSVRRPLLETVQPIPGPLTGMLSERARRYSTYVVTTLHEVDRNGHFYNTAVLIDRKGAIAGCYRKIHLTMEEAEQGILPGSEPLVFDADFGRIGVMICWDNWFSETARLLRLRGAEILVLPIAGDGTPGHWEVVSRTRAIDNGVYLVSSATVADTPSQIINPAGEILAEAVGCFSYAFQELDLNQQWRVRYLSVGPCLGEPRNLYTQERRPDVYHPLSKDN
jgi:predicted amidohydrolase